MAFRYAVALTGSIATGKSSVATCLRQLGAKVIDADQIAHEVLNAHYEQIIEIFGAEYVKEGVVDRKALGCVVFANKQKRAMLEQLLHPLIYERIVQQSIEEDKHKEVYFVDIPLFFEGGRYPIEKILVVYTPADAQLKRLMQRDCSSKEDALARIATQIPIEQKRQKATYVIENSGTLKELEVQCTQMYARIKKEFE